MAVYVDDYYDFGKGMAKLGRMKMSHMFADTPDELHSMACSLGLKREWFQSHTRTPHYDVSISKRSLAIQKGAIELLIRSKNAEGKRIWRIVTARIRKQWRETSK